MSVSGDKLREDLKPHLEAFLLGWWTAIQQHGSENGQAYNPFPDCEVLRKEAQRFVSEHDEHKEARFSVAMATIEQVVGEVRSGN